MPTLEWLKKHFRLPAEGAAKPGRYDPDYVPYLWGIFHALDDRDTQLVVMRKAAQVGWTFGLIGWALKNIDINPRPMLMLFPKDGAAREFGEEKFVPAARDCQPMRDKLDVSTTRKAGNRALKKMFPGGFVKLVGSNSISNVKSTPAPVVIVEEPDDTNDSVADQGDAISLARERLKRYPGGKLVLGGTPGVKGFSRVDEYMALTTQRVLPIECHDCGESHVLDWENVVGWQADEGATGTPHPVYGLHDPGSAVYACPHCGSVWDDWRRQQNILATVKRARAAGDPWCGWVATAPVHGGAEGFQELNELYVCMPGTTLADVVRDYLQAEHEAAAGEEKARIVFTNSKLARSYEYQAKDQATAEALRERALDYPEKACPRGGLLLTAGIDVQHSRVAVGIRAWGRSEESWLLYWGEIAVENTAVDKNDPVWSALDALVFGPIEHEAGGRAFVDAISIDSSDGQTSDAVYDWVRSRQKKYPGVLIMAVKGSSSQQDPEVFTTPRAKGVDHQRPDKQTKADRRGVKVYIVGTNRAKDWIHSHARLEGEGPGRWHTYEDVRADYWDQITSEVKMPHRQIRNRKVWTLKAGQRNEALDCETYALHAARARRVHLKKQEEWDALEKRILQSDLFTREAAPVVEQPAPRRKSDYWKKR